MQATMTCIGSYARIVLMSLSVISKPVLAKGSDTGSVLGLCGIANTPSVRLRAERATRQIQLATDQLLLYDTIVPKSLA